MTTKTRYCSVCGKPLPNDTKKKYCSFECKAEGRRRISREWKKLKELGGYPATPKPAGYTALAHAIVNTAIEDIRECSKADVLRYEDEAYRIKTGRLSRKFYDYMDSKDFLLGRRCTGFTDLSGKEIYKLLLKEKGLKYDGKRVTKRI